MALMLYAVDKTINSYNPANNFVTRTARVASV